MIQLQYLSSDEVPKIPHRAQPMQVAAYAPAALGHVRGRRGDLQRQRAPDHAALRGRARGGGLRDAGRRWAGRRARCSRRPSAAASSVASIGCIGNRVYTELADDELYLTVPAGCAGRDARQARHDRHRQPRAREVSSPARRHARRLTAERHWTKPQTSRDGRLVRGAPRSCGACDDRPATRPGTGHLRTCRDGILSTRPLSPTDCASLPRRGRDRGRGRSRISVPSRAPSLPAR